MKETTQELLPQLAYLHDAYLWKVTYDLSQKEGRTLTLQVECDPYAEHPSWDGKRLKVTAMEVRWFRYLALGHTFGIESIYTFDEGIFEKSKEKLADWYERGVLRGDELEFTIMLNSGSQMKFICEDLQVEIVEDLPTHS